MEKSVHNAVEQIVNREQTSVCGNLKDVTFSILFVANSIFIFVLAMTYGIDALSDPQPDKKTIDSAGHESFDESTHRDDAIVWLGGICVITVMSSLLSISFVYLVAALSASSISCTLYTVLAFSGACAVFLLVVGNIVGGILAVILLLMAFVFYFFVKDRLAFAAINMKTAGVAITAMPATLMYAYVVMLGAILWVFVWTIAIYGVATNEAATHIYHGGKSYEIDECTTYTYSGTVDLAETSLTCGSDSCSACVCDDSNGLSTLVGTDSCFSSQFYVGIYIAMLLSVLWAVNVFTHVVHCTTSGAVASWWFNASATPNSYVVKYSFLRAITSSFGPICLGSLLGAAVSVTRFTVRYMKSTTKFSSRNGCATPRSTSFVLSCLDTMLIVLEEAIKYVNRYAFCYVAIYGDSFIECSRSVYKLFRSRGLSAVINDGLIDTSMRFAQAIVGMLCLVVSHWYSYAVGLDFASKTALAAIAVVQGYFLSAITLKVFSAAVTTIYVCYAEDPQAFQGSHPELYIPLHEAWQKIYPPNADEIEDEDEAHEQEELLVGGEKSGYVPPSVDAIGRTKPDNAGPSWYYTSVATSEDPEESDDPKVLQGWDGRTVGNSKRSKKKNAEGIVVAAALAHPEATAAVATRLVSVAVANPDLMASTIGYAVKQKSNDESK